MRPGQGEYVGMFSRNLKVGQGRMRTEQDNIKGLLLMVRCMAKALSHGLTKRNTLDNLIKEKCMEMELCIIQMVK